MDFVKFYDEQIDYSSFRSNPQKLQEYKVAIQWKVDRLTKTLKHQLQFENILEVGCALGILLNKMADILLIKNRFGIDISPENIKYARENYTDTQFFCGTVDELKKDANQSFPNKNYDLVLLSDIVEHIPDDKKFLKEISTISNYVLLNLPLEKCFNNRKRKYGESDPSGHLRNYNLSDAKELVTSSGFEILFHFTDNAHFDKTFFTTYRKNRTERVMQKPLHLRIFWCSFYFLEELIMKVFPWLYKKKYGANFFALLKVKG